MSLLYTFSTGSTEVYSLPSYSSVTSAQTVSQINENMVKSVYSPNYQKIFAGPSGGGVTTGLTIYNSGNTATVINVSAETFSITIDNTYDLVAIINPSNGGPMDNVVVVVDVATDSVVSTIQLDDSGTGAAYKGAIASDNNGYCYVTAQGYGKITKIDIVNGVTASTFNISGIGGEIIYNPNNSYLYVYGGDFIRIYDTSDDSPVGSIPLTGTSRFFIYNPDKDYIYVGKVTGGTDDFIITTIRCANNTILGETLIYTNSSGADPAFGFYSPDTQYLYVGDIFSDSILVLTT